ncbi:hypothetical protein GCM10010353_45400 [Streptomyces chryseus]|nr:hypothetical protein GCM10010353_45400 [Streptomyces chryseus]
MTGHPYHSMPPLRWAVRRLARAYRLPVAVRARLVLSVTDLAEDELQAGRPVTLHTAQEAGADADSYVLAVTLRCPRATGPLAASGLPLPATKPSPDCATWRFTIPLPPAQPVSSSLPDDVSSRHDPWPDRTPGTDTQAVEEELRAAFAQTDAFGAEHRRLKHELAETNAGVLALYVQLEEGDEQLRRAHALILQELEDALRPAPLIVEGLELAVHYEPADPNAPTGGDLYDWFILPDGTLHITVVDALGHGLGSTRSALNVTHTVRTLALEGHPLQSILARTHEILMPLAPDLMATVLLARLDPATGKLQLANGSHPPALLLRTDGASRSCMPTSAQVTCSFSIPTVSPKAAETPSKEKDASSRRRAGTRTARWPTSPVPSLPTCAPWSFTRTTPSPWRSAPPEAVRDTARYATRNHGCRSAGPPSTDSAAQYEPAISNRRPWGCASAAAFRLPIPVRVAAQSGSRSGGGEAAPRNSKGGCWGAGRMGGADRSLSRVREWRNAPLFAIH